MITNDIAQDLKSKLTNPMKASELERVLGSLRPEAGYKGRPWSDLAHDLYKARVLREHRLKAANGKRALIYSSTNLKDIPLYDIAWALTRTGYFCHLTAIYYHGLTNQVPNSVYACPQTIAAGKRKRPSKLNDVALRTAFLKPPRLTNNVYSLPQGEVVLIDREKGTDFGVIEVANDRHPCPKGSRVAGLERALIDAVVAPHYNGGILSVLEYFEASKRKINVDLMIDLYNTLSFLYPFAQSIGFCLQKSGLSKQAKTWRSAFPPKQKFFLDRQAKTSWSFDEDWSIFVPPGLKNDH